MVKDDVLSALSTLGFIPQEVEGMGFEIDYEGLNILYPTEDDADSVNLIVPGIFEVTDENKTAVYDAIVELGGKMKYVQAYIMFGNKVWLNYIHYLDGKEVSPDLIEHMITVLAFATSNFHKIINEDESKG